MTDRNVKTAKAEAKRFLERVTALELEQAANGDQYGTCGPPRAAVRRASMDLTRALANLRRADR